MFQLFLDCVDRAIVSSTAFLSFRRQPMKSDDNRTLSSELLTLLLVKVFGQLLMTDATVVVMVKCGDKMLKQR